MTFIETQLKIRCGHLEKTFEVLNPICVDKLPISATVQIRKVRETLREYFTVFRDTWNALLAEYVEPGQNIESTHPHYTEWLQRAEKVLNEELTIPVSVPTVEALESWGVKLTVQELETLMGFGLVVEEPPKQGA